MPKPLAACGGHGGAFSFLVVRSGAECVGDALQQRGLPLGVSSYVREHEVERCSVVEVREVSV